MFLLLPIAFILIFIERREHKEKTAHLNAKLPNTEKTKFKKKNLSGNRLDCGTEVMYEHPLAFSKI